MREWPLHRLSSMRVVAGEAGKEIVGGLKNEAGLPERLRVSASPREIFGLERGA